MTDAAPGQADSPCDPPLLAWARRFLPHYFDDEPAEFHRELMASLVEPRRRLIALVAPRGHAKSTCAALAYPLWCACTGHRRNVVIITHEASLARQFVQDIRTELETNEHILAEYGALFAPEPPSATNASSKRTPTKRSAGKRAAGRSTKRKNAAAKRAMQGDARTTRSTGKRAATRREAASRPAGGRGSVSREASPPAPHASNQRPRAAARARRTTWTRDKLVTSTGVTIQAKGVGASLRGTRVGPQRPDLIICDDIEKDETVATPDGRRKLENWLRRVVMPALAPGGQLVVLGSLIHHDSLLANLRDRQRFPRWDYRVYRALEFERVGGEYYPRPPSGQSTRKRCM